MQLFLTVHCINVCSPKEEGSVVEILLDPASLNTFLLSQPTLQVGIRAQPIKHTQRSIEDDVEAASVPA